VSQVTLHRTSTFNLSFPQTTPPTHIPGSGLVYKWKRNALQRCSTREEDEFATGTLRELAIDARGLAVRARRAGSQALEFAVEVLRIEPVLEREGRAAVHDASRDRRDGERERENDV